MHNIDISHDLELYCQNHVLLDDENQPSSHFGCRQRRLPERYGGARRAARLVMRWRHPGLSMHETTGDCMPDPCLTAPFVCPRRHVEAAWIDHNKHMNMAYYSLVFDQSLDHLFDALGIDAAYYQQTTYSTFILESHVTFLREVVQDDPLLITYQLLDWDAKRLHLIATMQHAEKSYIAATSEQMSMHVDLETRRGAPFPMPVQSRIQAMMQTHASLPRPPQVGHAIGIPRR